MYWFGNGNAMLRQFLFLFQFFRFLFLFFLPLLWGIFRLGTEFSLSIFVFYSFDIQNQAKVRYCTKFMPVYFSFLLLHHLIIFYISGAVKADWIWRDSSFLTWKNGFVWNEWPEKWVKLFYIYGENIQMNLLCMLFFLSIEL